MTPTTAVDVDELGAGGSDEARSAVELDRGKPSAAELQTAARQAWLTDPTLTGAQLGAQFGRGERWGRDRITEAKATTAAPAIPTTTGPATAHPAARPALPGGRNGSHPGTARHSTGTPNAAGLPAGTSRRHDPSAAEHASAPAALLAVTVAAVVTVALVTMFTSYSHTMDLAAAAGQSRLVARILPAAVDGLVIAGSTSLLVDHHTHRPPSPLAWAAVALGLISSMAANVVAVDPTLVDVRHVKWVMAAYAPLALALSGHLLLRMLGQHHNP